MKGDKAIFLNSIRDPTSRALFLPVLKPGAFLALTKHVFKQDVKGFLGFNQLEVNEGRVWS